MTILAALVVAAVAGGSLFNALVRWERSGERARALGVIVVAVVVDAASGPGFDRGEGLLHPQVGGLNFRLPEVLITLALLARLAGSGVPRRIGLSMLWWCWFGLWYLASGVAGLVAGNDSTAIFFEAKVVLYVVGGVALAAGTPPDQLLRLIRRLLPFIGVAAGILFVLDQTGVSITAAIPLFPLKDFGEVGGDAATVFASFALLALALAAVDRERRDRYLACAAPLVLVPFAADQRAALIDLAAGVVVLVAFLFSPRMRPKVRTTSTELLLLALIIAAAVVVPAITESAATQSKFAVPLANEVQSSFENQAKIQSAQSRTNQWTVARRLVLQRPVYGWGLGKQYLHYEQGPDEVITSDLTHDIALDVLLRAGLIGLGLLLVALCATAAGFWQRLPMIDGTLAGLAVGGVSATIGILGKGAVESIFEKYLIATVLGLMLGTVRSVTTGGRDVAEARTATEELGSAWN